MLELKNISFNVKDKNDDKEIVKNISFKIEDDSFAVITGPNGGGKSTIAKIITGIEKPTEGQIFYKGEDITNLNITQRAKMGVGFAFQQPVKFKGFTVFDMLSLAAKNAVKSVSGKSADKVVCGSEGKKLKVEEACAYLSEVGLCAKDYVYREVNGSLSGGELKRIEIAMLIARGTVLSVFDEPEAGIDLWSFKNLIRVFQKMRESTKGTVVIISHQERILEIADKIIVIAGGEIKSIGNKSDILPELLKNSDTCKFYKED